MYTTKLPHPDVVSRGENITFFSLVRIRLEGSTGGFEKTPMSDGHLEQDLFVFLFLPLRWDLVASPSASAIDLSLSAAERITTRWCRLYPPEITGRISI
jgi:hypothetical protein